MENCLTPSFEVSPLDYHAKLGLDRSDIFSRDSWLSKSRIWELHDSSLFRWRFSPQVFTPTVSTEWGTLVDTLVTCPEQFEKIAEPHSFPNFRTKEAREFRDDAQAAGKILVNEELSKEVRRAADRILTNRDVRPVLNGAKTQVVLLSVIQGVQFKALVDIVPEFDGCLYDLKTVADLSRRGIEKAIGNFGYHVQAGIYRKLWNNLHPDDPRDRFRFIWQQSCPPYEVAITELPSSDIDAGEEWAAHHLDRLIKATKANRWPNVFDDQVPVLGRSMGATYAQEDELNGLSPAPSLK